MEDGLRRHAVRESRGEVSVGERHAPKTGQLAKKWDEIPTSSDKDMFAAWRDSMWRPLEPAVCNGLRANWDNAPWDYRTDKSFVGGEEGADGIGIELQRITVEMTRPKTIQP